MHKRNYQLSYNTAHRSLLQANTILRGRQSRRSPRERLRPRLHTVNILTRLEPLTLNQIVEERLHIPVEVRLLTIGNKAVDLEIAVLPLEQLPCCASDVGCSDW